MPDSLLHVVAGVLMDAGGRVLLAQRPPGKHLAGAWEFPGGKLETGESPAEALRRELHEELGIEIDVAQVTRAHCVPWRYPDKVLLLEALHVPTWHGVATPQEGQALRWQHPDHVDMNALAPADRPILTALRLPTQYAISMARDPAAYDQACAEVRTALRQGRRLLQLRQPDWPPTLTRQLVHACLPALRAANANLLLNGDIDGALASGTGIGVHLRAAQMRELHVRPLPVGQWVAASCHDARDLQCAHDLGVDFVVLGPVAATATHPDAAPMAWSGFAELVAATALPVYALGGMGPDDLPAARAAGAQGVAGIRAFWH